MGRFRKFYRNLVSKLKKGDQRDLDHFSLLADQAISCLSWELERSAHSQPTGQNLMAALLIASIVDLCRAATLLAQHRMHRGLSPILRSALEALVDLRNVERDAQHFQSMFAKYLSENLKVLRRAQAMNNPYLDPIGRKPDLARVIQQRSDQLAKLRKAGRVPLTIKTSAKLAGYQSEYESIYALLSGDSHSEIRALEEYHLVPRGGSQAVVWSHPMRVKEQIEKLSLTISLVAEARAVAVRMFMRGTSPKDKEMATLSAEVSRFMGKFVQD